MPDQHPLHTLRSHLETARGRALDRLAASDDRSALWIGHSARCIDRSQSNKESPTTEKAGLKEVRGTEAVSGRSGIGSTCLYIPKKKRIAQASVRWRHGRRLGLALCSSFGPP